MHRQIILKKQINIFRRFWHRTRTGSISPKEYKDIAPEHNEGIYLVPQIMANNAEVFLKAVQSWNSSDIRSESESGLPVPNGGDKYRGQVFWQNRMPWNSSWKKYMVGSISVFP